MRLSPCCLYSRTDNKRKHGKSEGGGGAKPDVKAINRNGEKFTTLVVRGVKAGKKDYYDAVEYLNTNIRTIDKFATRLG